jgi:C4-type Zn-finger protein
MQNYVPSFTEARPNIALGAPDCPICKSGMRFVQATPIVFTPGLVEVSYVCDECGQQTKRMRKGE